MLFIVLMVELVPAVCPKCGANLQLPENLDKAHCIYCGTEIIIEIKKPDIHYHGVGSVENYLKLGNRELLTAIQMERDGIEKEERRSKQVFPFLMVLAFLICIPMTFVFTDPIYGVVLILMTMVLVTVIFYLVPYMLKVSTEGRIEKKWGLATPLFREHIEEAVKYYNKALEINPENEEANQGYNKSFQLRKKYSA